MKPVFPNLFAKILVSRVFLILEHGIPGVMILKYGHVFLGQDTSHDTFSRIFNCLELPTRYR